MARNGGPCRRCHGQGGTPCGGCAELGYLLVGDQGWRPGERPTYEWDGLERPWSREWFKGLGREMRDELRERLVMLLIAAVLVVLGEMLFALIR